MMSLACFPQIRVLWLAREHVPNTSLLTWFIWVLGLSITTAYAVWVNGDLTFLLTSTCSLSGSVVVLSLATHKRWRYAAATSAKSAT